MTSIVIVTYHNSADIVGCLDALPWLDASIEVVVVDNHSRDATATCIRNWATNHPGKNLRFIQNKYNLGYAAGVNQGIRACIGDPILILGPDTELLKDTLSILIQKLFRDDRIGVTAPQIVDWKGNLLASCRRLPRMQDILLEITGLPHLFPGRFVTPWKMSDFDHQSEREVDQPEATCLLIRRKVIDSIGLMDERFPIFFNDVDWCRRIVDKGWKILFTPAARIRHKKGTSVRQKPIRLIWKSHQGCFRYFWKYRSGLASSFTVLGLGFLLIWAGILRSVCMQIGLLKE